MNIKNLIISWFLLVSPGCSNSNSNAQTNTSVLKTDSNPSVSKSSISYQIDNIINNAEALNPFQQFINKAASEQTVANVLHIGDSHIKSGYYSEPFMQNLNMYYAKRYNNRLFFNFQWFCKTGTKYSDYNDLAELDYQLTSTQPQLVIISLGTNDAFSGSSKKNFYEKVDHLVKKIKTLSPLSCILITTPPDALKYNAQKKAYIALPELINVVNTIVKYCTDNKIPFWNLYNIMGGSHSINSWVSQKLAAPDRVHFTQKGYGLFAQWLYEAFIKAIN